MCRNTAFFCDIKTNNPKANPTIASNNSRDVTRFKLYFRNNSVTRMHKKESTVNSSNVYMRYKRCDPIREIKCNSYLNAVLPEKRK
jgi:hypothetical protein